MTLSKVLLAMAAIALTACAAQKGGATDTTTAAAAASQMSGTDSLRATGMAGTRKASDSVGRNAIDTARIGRDTGRQSQNPNKQP